MDNIKNSDSVNLIIHGSNGKCLSACVINKRVTHRLRVVVVDLYVCSAAGQQQTIKIMRNPNGMPLTQEGVKAIVKEVSPPPLPPPTHSTADPT